MRRVVLAIAAVAISSSFVSAADLPARPVYKAPVVDPVANSWTGCYIGGNVGGAWANFSNYYVQAAAPVGGNHASGVVGGGQVGCDYQFAPNWVIGAQGMFSWGGFTGSNLYPTNRQFTDFSKVNWLSTVTGRVGWLATPAWLAYIKGGGAWVRNHFWETNPTIGAYDTSEATHGGWTIGGGVEYMFAPRWRVFLEYDYLDFGTSRNHFTGSVIYDYDIRQTIQQVIFGVNYKLY